MNKLLLSLTLAALAWTARADTTNLVTAKVYSQLVTNVTVQASVFASLHINCAVLHPPGVVCDYDKQKQWPSTEVTTVSKERVAEIEGQQFVLAREVISRTERTFTLKTTTERVYEATTGNPAFFSATRTESPPFTGPLEATAAP